MPRSVAGDPVFEDLSGLRFRRVKLWGSVAVAIGLIWVVAIALLILRPTQMPLIDANPMVAETAEAPRTRPEIRLTDAGLLIDAKASVGPGQDFVAWKRPEQATPRCTVDRPGQGAAMAAENSVFPTRVYTILPSFRDNAFLPLLRNCGRIDVIMPEWFEITGPSLAISSLVVDAETKEVLTSLDVERRGEVKFWPVFNLGDDITAAAFVEALSVKTRRTGLANSMLRLASDVQADGTCLRLQGLKAKDADVLVPFVAELATKTRSAGLQLCLVASISDGQWTIPGLVDHVDKVIVTAFQDPWLGSQPQPLAPLGWFDAQVAQIQRDVPMAKLVIAVGGHAVDWVSGQAVPERISMAEAMFRISRAKASIDFSPSAKNSYASFFDRDGNRHQIWMLDAASVHNNLQVLRDLEITEVAVASLGEEEPAYWDAVVGRLLDVHLRSLGVPEFPDNVIFTGEGPFYRLLDPGQPGHRLWRLDPESGMIVDLVYDTIPLPLEMERYGTRTPNQIALTFDDGPDAVATTRILDALKEQEALATFFVVGRAALASPSLLQRAVDEGHTIGSHSFNHPHMEDLSPFLIRAELNANRSLIEGVIGRSPLLYRPPYIRGPGPINKHEAIAFSVLEEEGYFVAGSDIVPADWAGISADEIVRQVFDEMDKSGGNVIVLHDGKSTGMHTAEAVSLLIPALRARGYEIVPLSTLLGATTQAVMPPVGLAFSVFKGVSVSAIGYGIAFLVAMFWVCVFASFARSALLLFLSARRDPIFLRTFAQDPSVSVLVPAYNEEKVIVDTLRSILASDYANLTCIVIDDGSEDGTLRIVAEAFGSDPRVKVLSQTNQGKWWALNTAFQQVDTEIAVCVDADTRIAPDAIREIVAPFADSKVAAVAGTVTVANTSRLLAKFQAIEYITAQQIGRRAQDHLNGIMVVPGALGAWRVDAVLDVGLYSNETLTEDADLTIWLRRGGYRVAYAENARSQTEAPADVRSLLKQRLRWSLGNLQTLWKHRGAFLEFGPKRLFSMFDMVFFGYLLPLVSPVVDLIFLYFVFDHLSDWHSGTASKGLDVSQLALIGMAAVQVMDIAVAWTAHRREGIGLWRRILLIPMIPLMNMLYRPLLYVTIYRALWSALSGKLARWNKLHRLGTDQMKDAAAR